MIPFYNKDIGVEIGRVLVDYLADATDSLSLSEDIQFVQ